MKKKIALLLLTVMAISLIACGKKDTANTDDAVKDETKVESALEIYQSIWATYEDDEKFSACGGDSENAVMGEAGTFDVTDTEGLDVLLGFPTDCVDKIDDAASLMHMQNANSFTSGAFHVTKADDVQAVADALKENIMNRQWCCGFPDTLVIYKIDDNYLVSAFGKDPMMATFKSKLAGVYADAVLVYEESL